jgi:hypothetical protein
VLCFTFCTIVVSTVQVSYLETPGEKKQDKEGKKDYGCGRYLTGRMK